MLYAKRTSLLAMACKLIQRLLRHRHGDGGREDDAPGIEPRSGAGPLNELRVGVAQHTAQRQQQKPRSVHPHELLGKLKLLSDYLAPR